MGRAIHNGAPTNSCGFMTGSARTKGDVMGGRAIMYGARSWDHQNWSVASRIASRDEHFWQFLVPKVGAYYGELRFEVMFFRHFSR